MTVTKLGKVSLTPQGEYDAAKTYQRLDVVTHDGSSYVAVKDFTGTVPTDGNGNVLLLAARGKTAYEHAVTAGYSGTLLEFEAEVMAIAASGERMLALENGKADLIAGVVPTNQMPAMYGKQSGAATYEGYYRTTNVGQFSEGDVSAEVYFSTAPESYGARQGVLLYTHSSLNNGIFVLPSAIQSTELNSLDIYVGGKERAFARVLEPSRSYHLVITVDPEEKTFSIYLNGRLLGTDEFTAAFRNSAFGLGGPAGSWGTFPGVVHHSRMFGKTLSEEEILTLWNAGRPDRFDLRKAEKDADGYNCVAEYLSGSCESSLWRETSGKGADLPAVDSPEVSYLDPQAGDGRMGAGAPSVIPEYVGQEFYDISNRNIYKAIGTASAADWLLIS